MGEEQWKRACAVKMLVAEVKSLPFVKQGGWASSYLQAQEPISRFCLAGTVIQKSGDNLSLVVDDGSGSVALRVFEDRGMLAKGIGDVVLVVGKPREFGSERYVLPEIVKVVDAGWLMVHLKWVSKRQPLVPMLVDEGNKKDNAEIGNHDVSEEVNGNRGSVEQITENPAEKICAFIRQRDAGDGVDVQEIIEARVAENCETLVSQLLRNGDIFEIKPGRVKVL